MNLCLVVLSSLLGFGSLFVFALFLFSNGFDLLTMPLGTPGKLAWDGLLCLMFFVQHSVMVRPSFRARLSSWMAPYRHAAFYAICSGAILLVLVLFWQTTDRVLLTVPPFWDILVRGVFFLTMIPFYLSVRALGAFDSLGLKPLIDRNARQNPNAEILPLAIKGPYRWVRHPIYLVSIIAFWATPQLTSDRLLFNITWTIWIFIGAYLEEKDLRKTFGKEYQSYQDQVPMIIPKSLRPLT